MRASVLRVACVVKLKKNGGMRYHRAIAFHRTFSSGAPKPDWVEDDEYTSVFPFETDDDKVAFVRQLANDANHYSILYGSRMFVSNVCDATLSPNEDDEMDVNLHGALTLLRRMDSGLKQSDVPNDYEDTDYNLEAQRDDVTISLTFRIHSREAKLEFARWIEETRFGDFLCPDARVFLTWTVSSDADAAASAAGTRKRAALQSFSDCLFSHRAEMTDEAYRQLSKAMKTVHDAS